MPIVLQPRTICWALLLGTLAVMAPVRMAAFVADAQDLSDPVPGWLVVAGVLTIAVLFALHLAIALPGSWPFGQRGVLLAQTVLTFVPYLVFGRSWGPIAGLLAASTLLTMQRSRGWAVFAGVVSFDAALRTWGPWGIARSGQIAPAEATHTDISSIEPWLAFSGRALAITIFGLLLFGLTRLAQLTQQVHAAREELAAIEVARDRLQAASGFRAAVGDHLDAIVAEARAAMGDTPSGQRASLRDIAGHGRQAMAAVRLGTDARSPGAIGRSNPDAGTIDIGSRALPNLDGASSLAERVLAGTIAAYGFSFLVNLAGERTSGAGSWALAATVVLLAGGCALRHLRPDRGVHGPRYVPMTLLLQLLATVVALGVFELQALPLMSLAAGAVLVRVRLPWSLLVIAAGVVALPVLVPMAGGTVGWHVYRTAMVLTAAVALYALHRIPEIAQNLQATRRDAVKVAVALDRARVARDVHDLLGFGLSAISLRAEVAALQLGSQPGSADDVLEELIALADGAVSDVRSLAVDEAELDLSRELRGAAALLESVGIGTRIRGEDAALPPPVDALFSVVIREAVTNVLRHANASMVDIVMTVARREALLEIRNDGAHLAGRRGPARRSEGRGRGIENLTVRAATVGGEVTTVVDGTGGFELMVRVPMTRQRADRPAPLLRDSNPVGQEPAPGIPTGMS